MSYQVLALKYRPQSFPEAVGQEAVTITLKNAIAQERLHHAYLFAGPRGVGKTSLARIFAKSLNCEKGPTIEPCQRCTACQEITNGHSMDVQEIDGASNTSVDDIRSLRESIKYTPSSGRYRIYIIDEVHMLSKSAFAALLKTLEEPPEHVRFIFATTDPEKIPATILSRILRFDFRRPSTELLVNHLANIAKQEKIEIEREGLLWIARQAEGSFRDALSLLDRVISFAGQKITTEQVISALGITGRTAVFHMLQAVLQRDTVAALKFVQELYKEGQDLKLFGQEFLEAIRDVLIHKLLGDDGFPDWGESEIKRLSELSADAELADLEYLFHLYHRAYREIVYSPLPKILLEITVVRLCTRADRQNMAELLARLEAVGGSAAVQAAPAVRAVAAVTRSAPLRKTEPEPVTPNANPEWSGFLDFIEQKKPPLAAILSQASWQGDKNGTVEIGYPASASHRMLLEDETRQILVRKLVKDYFKKDVAFVSVSTATAAADVKEQNTNDNASIINDAIEIFNPKEKRVS